MSDEPLMLLTAMCCMISLSFILYAIVFLLFNVRRHALI